MALISSSFLSNFQACFQLQSPRGQGKSDPFLPIVGGSLSLVSCFLKIPIGRGQRDSIQVLLYPNSWLPKDWREEVQGSQYWLAALPALVHISRSEWTPSLSLSRAVESKFSLSSLEPNPLFVPLLSYPAYLLLRESVVPPRAYLVQKRHEMGGRESVWSTLLFPPWYEDACCFQCTHIQAKRRLKDYSPTFHFYEQINLSPSATPIHRTAKLFGTVNRLQITNKTTRRSSYNNRKVKDWI